VDQYGELVAAETRDRVFLPHRFVDARGDAVQQPIADGVAEGVVDQC